MKSLLYLMAAALLLNLTGCKELDRLAEIEEIERYLAKMQGNGVNDTLTVDVPYEYEEMDSVITDKMNVDSTLQNAMVTAIKKVKLEGHDYWTITAVGYNMGGAGITHSESCWCKRTKPKTIENPEIKNEE